MNAAISCKASLSSAEIGEQSCAFAVRECASAKVREFSLLLHVLELNLKKYVDRDEVSHYKARTV